MGKVVGELTERSTEECRKNTDNVQIFEVLDKGIDDMETGRVIDHKEAMRILENRFKS